MAAPVVIKKYANRRLYDTGESRYVTLEELAEKIRLGADCRVVDAATGEDLTQSTLAQIILESRGASKLLPVPLLTQLIRMGDDALAEFLGRYLSTALEMYVHAKQGAQAVAAVNPFATLPFQVSSGLARMFMGAPFWQETTASPGAPPPIDVQAPPPGGPPPPAPPAAPVPDPVAELRRELEELKAAVRGKKKPRK
jgi:polyhydroxyalkanoate synthesis repressor PhaR